MDLSLECIYCTMNKADSLYSEHEADAGKKLQFMKKVFGIIAKSAPGDTPPSLAAQIMRVLNSELQLGDPYNRIKKEYNSFLVSLEDEILGVINAAEDRLLIALKFAMVGNFIDFGAMDEVDIEELKDIIHNAPQQTIDRVAYEDFCKELEDSQRVAYLADNAGEIVLDKIFIRIIKEFYPDIKLDVIVRGQPIYNDATLADAREIGLCDLVQVVDNGTDIPGTQLSAINKQSRAIIDNAEMIIAKGQGNFETLYGCGKNIYYLFLCKCDLFTRRFNMEKFRGILVNEKNVKELMGRGEQ